MKLLVFIASLVGCASQPKGPTAILRFYDPAAWSAKDKRDVEAGVIAWQSVGFVGGIELKTNLPRCPNDWYKRSPQVTECVIEIGVIRERGLMVNHQVMGQADRVTDTIHVDSLLFNFDLIHVIAHEVGHILMNTSKHTAKGVMLSGGWEWWLSVEDKALACETIQRGCK
jgi:hypothetical protein